MNIETLKPFCGIVDDPRYYLQKPFPVNDFNCATNGHIAVFTEGEAEDHEDISQTLKDTVIKLHDECRSVNYTNVTLPGEPKKTPCGVCRGTGKIEKCYECGGTGEVELEGDFNAYECGCKTCDSTGTISGDDAMCGDCNGDGWRHEQNGRVGFGGSFVNWKYLDLIRDLPEIKFNISTEEKEVINFKFKNGYGVIMPMRA